MDNSSILRIATIVAIIGITLLYLSSIMQEATSIDISSLKNFTDKTIKIRGMINKIQTTDNSVRIKISQSCFADILFDVFNTSSLSEEDMIEITGKAADNNMIFGESLKKI